MSDHDLLSHMAADLSSSIEELPGLLEAQRKDLKEANAGRRALQAEIGGFSQGSDHQVWTEGSWRIPALYIADWPDRYIHTQRDVPGNLDPTNTYEVVQILKKINDLGTTVVLTTHNRGVIESIGKRVVTLEKGKVLRDDKEGKYAL